VRRDGADQGRAEELRAAELGGALVAELATQQRREDAPLGAWRGPEVLAVAGAREHDQVRRFGPRIVEPVGPEREAYHGTRRREAREVGRLRVGADDAGGGVGGEPALGRVARVGQEAHVHRRAASNADGNDHADQGAPRRDTPRSRLAPEGGQAEAGERRQRGDQGERVARHRVEDRDHERQVVREAHRERHLGPGRATHGRQDEPCHAGEGEWPSQRARRGAGGSEADAHHARSRERDARVGIGGARQLARVPQVAARIDGEEGCQGVDGGERSQGRE